MHRVKYPHTRASHLSWPSNIFERFVAYVIFGATDLFIYADAVAAIFMSNSGNRRRFAIHV